MTRPPQVSGERVIRALQRFGFVEVRRTGSHAILRHATEPARRATVPLHGGKDVRPGTLRAILEGAGVSIEDLKDVL